MLKLGRLLGQQVRLVELVHLVHMLMVEEVVHKLFSLLVVVAKVRDARSDSFNILVAQHVELVVPLEAAAVITLITLIFLHIPRPTDHKVLGRHRLRLPSQHTQRIITT